MDKYIHIKGARVHNLKNIELKIPRGKLIVITGPSGSGKSSLAFDTIYAEGQRRYVESLSAYARQFLEKMPKPDVDFISGVAPAISIQQKAPSGNPRSTVGTLTEIYDYLRLLYARIGEIYCHKCGEPIQRDSNQSVLEFIADLPAGEICYIAFPLPEEIKQKNQIARQYLLSEGFMRVWQDGHLKHLQKEAVELTAPETYVVVDRIRSGPNFDRNRALESIETAFHSGEGFLTLIIEPDRLHHFNKLLLCNRCGTRAIAPEPRLFSFNSPFGACPGCQGFGDMMDLDLKKIIPDPSKSLRRGAIAPWSTPAYRHMLTELAYLAPQYGIRMDAPWESLSPQQQEVIINGDDHFPGIRGFFEWLETKKYKVHVRVFISRYRSYFTCTLCHGARLRPEALAIKIGGKNISELTLIPIERLYRFFNSLKLSGEQEQIAEQLLKEIRTRLKYLIDVGLGYLHLNRRANTLSGGEFQRINLASALGSSLTGVLYILDEPTIGLHPRDTRRLIKILQSLVKAGNTVIVVEHDPEMIQAADHIIDLGPASGEWGGRIMYQGTYPRLIERGKGITASWLRGEKEIPRRSPVTASRQSLTIVGAREHNLKNLTVRIPLGQFVCLTGVSGSGKSTLVMDILYHAYQAKKGNFNGRVGSHDKIVGLEQLDRIEMVDQSPIGRTPRSNPVTYIKAFDEIRKIFARTAQARARGFTPAHFSFNVPGGRCDQCNGDGEIKIEMQFLADVYILCDACKGKRFKPSVLDVYYHGKNIHDVLQLTVDEAVKFFQDHPALVRKLKILQQVGLGYLRLGQPAPTLSGGEAQRIKIAAHLTKKQQGKVLFIMDEPTTGLHLDEISKLLQALDLLLKGGASLLVIEHNLQVIKNADWIIELGPEGGEKGGRIVAEGTPEELARKANTPTGEFLRRLFDQETARKIPLKASTSH